MNAWPKQSECAKFYGDPDPERDGTPSRAWEDQSLLRVVPPWRMALAWDVHAPVRSILIHKKCAASLEIVLRGIWEWYARDQIAIEAAGLHLFGGAYNFRLKRGGHTLSMHAYGCAIDLDPEHNAFGSHRMRMPVTAINLFKDEGWTWGGSFSYPDGMHFQAANVG